MPNFLQRFQLSDNLIIPENKSFLIVHQAFITKTDVRDYCFQMILPLPIEFLYVI